MQNVEQKKEEKQTKSRLCKRLKLLILLHCDGARGRNRTGTAVLGPTDFKSVVSTYFTTRATL